MSLHTEELYKKDLHDIDNYSGVITHLEPDILECESSKPNKICIKKGENVCHGIRGQDNGEEKGKG